MDYSRKKTEFPEKKIRWSFQNGTWTHDKSTSSKFEHHQPIQLKQLLLASARLAPASTPVSIPRTTLCTPTSPLPFAPPASRSKQQAVSFRPVQNLPGFHRKPSGWIFFQSTIVTPLSFIGFSQLSRWSLLQLRFQLHHSGVCQKPPGPGIRIRQVMVEV